jgi:hypothetical protein
VYVPTIIGVEEVERFRATDPRAHLLPRAQLVARDDAVSTDQRPVYVVCGQHITLTAVGGGFTAVHPGCRHCQSTPCFRVLAAVDAEGTCRFVVAAGATYRAAKRAMAR